MATLAFISMRHGNLSFRVVLLVFLFVTIVIAQPTSDNGCERTAQMRVYSNPSYIEEAGDVVGYELAVQQGEGNAKIALLYLYEGVPNQDGISVAGHIADGKLSMQGDWIERLVEYPSKKPALRTRHLEEAPDERSASFDSLAAAIHAHERDFGTEIPKFDL